jgi:hypothetical protein
VTNLYRETLHAILLRVNETERRLLSVACCNGSNEQDAETFAP